MKKPEIEEKDWLMELRKPQLVAICLDYLKGIRALEAERDALTVQRDYWYELTNRAMLLLPGWPEEGIHVPAAKPSPAPAPETRASFRSPIDGKPVDCTELHRPPAKPKEG